MTNKEVKELIQCPNKIVARQFAWTIQESGHTPKVNIFESALIVGNQVLEGVHIRASYRGTKIISKGISVIEIPAKFDCALFMENKRIAALDTNPAQKHTNKIGANFQYFGKTISSYTHQHIWIGEYGYAEPVEPPLNDVVALLKFFAKEYNVTFQGSLYHPLDWEQGDLL